MNELRDPRIDAKSFTGKSVLLMFLCIMLVCGCFLVIYIIQPPTHNNGEYIALSIITYLVVISLMLTMVLTTLRNHLLLKPLNIVQQAARSVARGDFSVRIAPQRNDGKMDEFEVLYADFNTMVAELSSTEMLKKDFISNVSHELKTPIAVIKNYSTILQSDGLTDDERLEYVKRIGTASTRLSELVSSILQISQLENQKVVACYNCYNLSEQLCRCAINFEQVMDEKNIELQLDLDQNIQIKSDEGLMDIVWNNLLSNAFKFTDFGGIVKISTTKDKSQISVSIMDSGCGITEKAVHHIFDKFYQADTSHTTNGNGLGLAMVKQVIELLHGMIKVDSTLGQGSTFTVYLNK